MCMGGGGGSAYVPSAQDNQYRIDTINTGGEDPGSGRTSVMRRAMSAQKRDQGSLLAPNDSATPQGGSTLLGQ